MEPGAGHQRSPGGLYAGKTGQTITGNVQQTLTVQLTANGCLINWATGVSYPPPTLQGPWAAVPGATTPSYNYMPSGTTNQFFRAVFNGGGSLP